MKAKLIKTSTQYILCVDEKVVNEFGSALDTTYGWVIADEQGDDVLKLSSKNCQAIELGYDLDELVSNHSNERWKNSDSPSHFNQSACEKDFKSGFQKALEILSDKKYTEDDMLQMAGFSFSAGRSNIYTTKEAEQDAINYLPQIQSTEWEVEIVMDICGDKVYAVPEFAKDENDCLILKRKE